MKHLLICLLLPVLLVGCNFLNNQNNTAQQPTDALTPPPVAPPTAASASTEVPPVSAETPTVTATSDEPASTSSTRSRLQEVQARGVLRCGINGGLPGFSVPDTEREVVLDDLNIDHGNFVGFDADYCRVIAAAIFGDADAVEFFPLSSRMRFQAVVDGDVDVLIRNSTWTASRDTGIEGADPASTIRLDFGPTTYHDGQRFLVRRDLTSTTTGEPVGGLSDLAGYRICYLRGTAGAPTTTEQNLRDQFQAMQLAYAPVPRNTVDEVFAAYENGECEAVTSDTSQLAVRRALLANPDEHRIIDQPISKEPLGPIVAENDSTWHDVVNWAVYATMEAELLQLASTDSADAEDPQTYWQDRAELDQDPRVRRFLGNPRETNIGENMGLSNDFALNIVREVGSYAEIYTRNLGPDTPYVIYFDQEEQDFRGPNKIGMGGLLVSPPFR